MIIGIVAISENYAIGKNGRLPWHYPADLKFFKETTTGNAIVMGSNTWRSIAKPLPGRLNVVLSRTGNVDTPAEVMRLESRDEVIALSDLILKDLFIIGGAKTFEDFADAIDKWIVTEVPLTVDDADTFMPAGFLDDFDEVERLELGDDLRVRVLHRR